MISVPIHCHILTTSQLGQWTVCTHSVLLFLKAISSDSSSWAITHMLQWESIVKTLQKALVKKLPWSTIDLDPNFKFKLDIFSEQIVGDQLVCACDKFGCARGHKWKGSDLHRFCEVTNIGGCLFSLMEITGVNIVTFQCSNGNKHSKKASHNVWIVCLHCSFSKHLLSFECCKVITHAPEIFTKTTRMISEKSDQVARSLFIDDPCQKKRSQTRKTAGVPSRGATQWEFLFTDWER